MLRQHSVILFLVSLAAAPAYADDRPSTTPAGQRVFYTGHSFHMFVPPRVEQLVKSAGIEGHKLVGTQGIGGSRVIQHWDLEEGKNKAKPSLASGEVDVFTMAAHLAIPDEGIAKFTELGLAHNPNLRLFGRIENLTNAKYEDPGGYNTAGFSVYAGLKWTDNR